MDTYLESKDTGKNKVLLWLILHGHIMTNKERVRRGFTTIPCCPSCPNAIEDINHMLRACDEARQVWHYFEMSSQGIHVSNLGINDWILQNIGLSHQDHNWPTKFTLIIW